MDATLSHLVRYLDDPRSSNARDLGYEFAPSLEAAIELATARIGDLRIRHGARVGYVIEDRQGRRVRLGP